MIEINLSQAKELADAFGGDDELMFTLVNGDEEFHLGPGMYGRDDYWEYGCVFLGKGGE